jgi:NAD(P)H-dependent FMN reductase
MLNLKIIIGSTRPGRAADLVVPWISGAAREHGAFDVEVLDLRDWQLPIFGETFATLGDPANPAFSVPRVRQWNDAIGAGDAYLFVTPEYNHSVPGGLKNAIDTVWISFGFRNKPVAFVGYSGGQSGAIRAIEHLAHIFVETESVPMRNSVVIPFVRDAFDADGQPKNPITNAAAGIMLDDLAWWTTALDKARAEGELAPGSFRLQAALAAAK